MMNNQSDIKTNIYTKNIVLSELITGILVFGLVFQLILIPSCIYWFKGGIVYYSSGLWIGIVIASLLAIHMNSSISKAIDFDEETAIKIARKDSIIRYLVLLIVFGILMVTDIVSPIVAFIGTMGLKMGAYMQPTTHRFLRSFGPESVREYIKQDDIRRSQMLEEYYEEQKRLEAEKALESQNQLDN